jgi:hypothetical protein
VSDECVIEGCDRPVHDNYLICARHGDELARDLADPAGLCTDADGHPVPSLSDELAATVSRQDKLTVRSDRRGATTGLPWKEPAADAAWVLANTLSTWARDLAETRGVELDATTVSETAEWLHRRVDWIRQHEAAEEAHGDLTAAIRNARAAIDLPANRARFEVGPCPEDTDGRACPGTVWAYIPTREEDPALMRCTDCGTEWSTPQWLRVGRRILSLIEQRKRQGQHAA